MAKKKKKGSIIGKIITVVNIISACGLLLCYLSMWINPETMPYLALVGYAYPILLALNVCFVILWGITLRRRFLYSLIVILVGYNVFYSHFEFFNKEIKTENEISIINFNTGHNIDKKALNRSEHIKSDNDSILQMITKGKYDIMCLQEVHLKRINIENITRKQKVNLSTSGFMPNQINKSASFVTISRFPIVHTEELVLDDITFVLISDILINSDTVRIYNTHLFSNGLSNDDIQNVNNVADSDGKVMRLLQKLNNKITQGAEVRSIQAKMIRDNIRGCNHKPIICGDFNDTPCSYTYNIMCKDMKDSFTERGSGWGNTYNGKLPNIRIDYILVDKSFKVNSYKLLDKITISDHFPITCSIELKNDRK